MCTIQSHAATLATGIVSVVHYMHIISIVKFNVTTNLMVTELLLNINSVKYCTQHIIDVSELSLKKGSGVNTAEFSIDSFCLSLPPVSPLFIVCLLNTGVSL